MVLKMNKLIKLKKMISNKIAKYRSFGGESRSESFFPKGLYSKAREKEEGLVLGLLDGRSNDIVMPRQKEISLAEGDVVVTDGKSKILFEFRNGKLIIEAKEILYKNCNVNFQGGSVKHDGINIDSTHKHGYWQQALPSQPAKPASLQKTQRPT